MKKHTTGSDMARLLASPEAGLPRFVNIREIKVLCRIVESFNTTHVLCGDMPGTIVCSSQL